MSAGVPVSERDLRSGSDPTWGAAIVNHGSYEDLESCLASIVRQTRPALEVVVWDTGVDPTRLAGIAAEDSPWRYRGTDAVAPPVHFESASNLGYAGGANRAISLLLDAAGHALPDFVLVLNPDVVLDADFAERLVASVASDPPVALASGKLLRPDRRTVDSAGIVFPRHRRPRDRGSEELDDGRFDRRERVDAASGAALLVRSAAIPRLEIEGELFDESFFAYHEDTDLCWRARRLGFDVLYEPAAVAVHARGWQRAGRHRVPVEIRRHSFRNHYLQLVKNETPSGFLRNAPWLLGWEVLRLGFVLLRDIAMLPAYVDAARRLPAAWRKRAALRAKIAR